MLHFMWAFDVYVTHIVKNNGETNAQAGGLKPSNPPATCSHLYEQVSAGQTLRDAASVQIDSLGSTSYHWLKKQPVAPKKIKNPFGRILSKI